MPPKRKVAAPAPPIPSSRGNKRARQIVISDDENDYLPTPDESRQEEEDYPWEDMDDESTPLVPSSSRAQGKAKSKKGGKSTSQPAKSYGTRKQVFHWLHYHVRNLIESFGELEKVRIIRAQSERALEHARRKATKDDKEKIELEIELEKVKLERYKLLASTDIAAEFQLLIKDKDLEVQRANDATAEVQAHLEELKIQVSKLEIEKEQAVKDRLAMEERVVRAQLEAKRTGRTTK